MLEHGGRVRAAAQHYGIPAMHWLDLSTGINPRGYPVPAIPAEVWNRLPEPEDDLVEAAREYYGSKAVLPVAGSQAAIRALPRLRPPGRIGVLAASYNEHAAAWRAAGHRVEALESLTAAPADLDGLVVCNPNNPTGQRFTAEELLAWQERLAARGGWLVVDEAFADAEPELALARHLPRQGLIVLRSLGKFFGLAGARVGFVLGEPSLLAALDEYLGPWTINGPARAVAARALADRQWQQATRQWLPVQVRRLAAVLEAAGLTPAGVTSLFAYVPTPDAAAIAAHLAEHAILVRCFQDPPALRFGLPDSETGWQRLEQHLGSWSP